MIFVDNNSIKDAAFHFSVEELFTRYIQSEKPVFMLWQADKTVMLGNNQVYKAEVDNNFAKSSGIKTVRRSSGGGAIYTDLGTILYTVIEPLTDETKEHRERIAETIINALIKLGVPAKREGRNDILADGKKFSGFAQYTSGTHVCTHGSLLYDTDLETLTSVLIANEDKLLPKGIKSIRSRVTNIKPYISGDYTVDDFIKKLKDGLLFGKDFSVYNLSEDELSKVNRIKSEKYNNNDWNQRM